MSESSPPAPAPGVPDLGEALRMMLRPQLRGVGLMVPKGVDPATLTPPEPTPPIPGPAA